MGSGLQLLNPLPAVESQEPEIGWGIFFYTALVVAIVLVYAGLARRGITRRLFVGLPARLAEHLFLFLEEMAVSVIGSHGRKYVPYLLSLWLFIFVGNVMGLVLQFTPTADWSLNLSLSIATVLYVQYEGIRANGLFGHLRHFAGPKLPGAMVAMGGLIFCVEIVSEAMKMVSLSLRLYGNIEGGHIVVSSLNSIVPLIPFGGILLPIKLFTCVIQAYVFVMLTCVYLALVTSHDHGEESDDGHETAHAAPTGTHGPVGAATN
jgi:F-type H+-transporting ATPase subunit a